MNAMKLCRPTTRFRWFKSANISRNISLQCYYDEDRHECGNDCLFILQPPEHDW